MTVLLWGLPEERPLAAVRAELERLGAPVVVLDQRGVLQTAVELEVGCEVRGRLRSAGWELDLEEVTAFLVRPHDFTGLPAVAAAGPGSAAWRHALRVHQTLLSWAEIAAARVVNRPSACAANGSKPYQAELIRRHGFAIPETLVTTDPDAVRGFHERHGAVVYKSVSAIRSVVTRLTPVDLDRLGDVAACPTQFQAYVPGVDVRVHVVGDEVFACEVASDAADYRYPGRHRVEIRPCALPADIAARCRAMVAAMDLAVAGIDLRCSAEGAWHCFEVNPSPAFTYFERATGPAVRRAIARFLAG